MGYPTMSKQDTLKPRDVVVGIALAVWRRAPNATFAQLGEVLQLSPSTVHESVRRLQAAGLLRPSGRVPNRLALEHFLEHGVRYVFPPAFGKEAWGVPTAHVGPMLKDQFDTQQPVVWPDAKRRYRGTALQPLYPQATALPENAPEIYSALTLVDALRIGQARERNAALKALKLMLHSAEAGAPIGAV